MNVRTYPWGDADDSGESECDDPMTTYYWADPGYLIREMRPMSAFTEKVVKAEDFEAAIARIAEIEKQRDYYKDLAQRRSR